MSGLDSFAAKTDRMKTPDHNFGIYKGRTSSISTICRSAIALLFLFPAFIFSVACDDGAHDPHDRIPDMREHTICLKTVPVMGQAGGTSGGTVDVFIYNDDALKRLDAYQRLEIGKDHTVDAASGKGRKIVVAILNPQMRDYEWNGISSLESISGMYADLCMESPETPVMSGTAFLDAETDSSCEMMLAPLVSVIDIRSIRCDFSGKLYDGEKLENAYAYLTNVNSLALLMKDKGFMPAAPLNSDGYHYESSRRMMHPEMVYADFPANIGAEKIQPGIRLYCYPNSSIDDTAGTPFTRLVIAGDISGTRYYYPININGMGTGSDGKPSGIDRNCRYVLDLTITQTGVTDPSVPVSPEAVMTDWTVMEWNSLPETEIEF